MRFRCNVQELLFLIISILLLTLGSCVSGPEGSAEAPAEDAPAEDVYESIGNYVITGDVAGAIEAFETLNRERPDDPETKNAYVKLLLAAGKLDQAAEITAAVLESYPENIGALFNTALIAGFTGDNDGREGALRRVVELDPSHADAQALLGELCMERKRCDEAEGFFSAALEAEPDNLVANSAMAQILRRRGDYTGALQQLDMVLEIDPAFSFAWADRGAVKAASGNPEGAEDDYSKAIELDPDYYWHYIDRAGLRIRSRRPEEALEDLDRAIELDPEHFYGYILRAGVRDDLNMHTGAVDDYYTVLDRRPDYHFAFESLAVLLFMEERWTEAEDMFVKAYPYARERYEFLLLAGLCRRREGSPSKDYLYEQVNRIPRDNLLYHAGRVFLEPGYASAAISKIQAEGKSFEGTRALFYLAEYFLLTGSEQTAFTYFFEIEERNIPGLMETRLAEAERKKISDIP